MDSKLEQDYKQVRRLVVRGELTSKEAKVWLRDIEQRYFESMQDKLKRFSTNCNREGRDMRFLSEKDDE